MSIRAKPLVRPRELKLSHPFPEGHFFCVKKTPDHNTDEAFPFADVFDIARTTFKGLHQLSLLPAELWCLLTGLRASEHATNRPDDRDLCDLDRHHRTDEREYWEPDRGWRAPDREPYPRDLPLCHEPKQPYIPAPNIETHTVRFKELACDDNDRKMEELLDKMHGLSVHERAYAHLYAQCFCRFPEFVRELPKPEIVSAAPSATFVYQAPTALLTLLRPTWPRTSDPAPASVPVTDTVPYFRT